MCMRMKSAPGAGKRLDILLTMMTVMEAIAVAVLAPAIGIYISVRRRHRHQKRLED